jgi:carboxymethylenebutenolidase
MSHEEIAIPTGDGACRSHFFRPDGEGSWPGVLFFMDGLGIRPALLDMCERLAGEGFAVLLPDLFHRAGPYEPLDPKQVFASGDIRTALGHLFASTDHRRVAEDTAAFLAHLDARPDVAGRAVGVTGYCMGGGFALTAAGTHPERIAAAASFHGGRLATDDPDSPHRLAPKMRAQVYVAGADRDDSYPPEMAARLEEALTEAGVPHRCEIYAGALHGFTMADFPVYDEPAAERHWEELVALFRATLPRSA